MYNVILKIINIYMIVALFPINRGLFEKIYILDSENIKTIIIVLAIISIIDMMFSNNIRKLLQFKSILLYPVLILVISLFNSINKLQSAKLSLVLICMCIYIINISFKHMEEKIDIISSINLGSFIFLILNYIFIYLYPSETQYIDFRYGITLQGITGHRLHLGICCSLIVIMSYINLINSCKKFEKIISIFNIISSLYFMYNSKSDTALFALIIVLLLIFINNKVYVKGSIVILLSNFATVIYISMIPIIDKISSSVNVNLTLTGRTDIWRGILEMINMRKIGYGLATFWETNQYSDYYSYNYYNGGHAHNGILEMVLELGVVGAVAVIMCLWHTIKKLRERNLYRFISIKFAYVTLTLISTISITEPVLFSYQYVNLFNYILLISLCFINYQKVISEKSYINKLAS